MCVSCPPLRLYSFYLLGTRESTASSVEGVHKFLGMLKKSKPSPASLRNADLTECNIERISVHEDPAHAFTALGLRLQDSWDMAGDFPAQMSIHAPIILTDLYSEKRAQQIARTWGNLTFFLQRFGQHIVKTSPPLELPLSEYMPGVSLHQYVSDFLKTPVDPNASKIALDFSTHFSSALNLSEMVASYLSEDGRRVSKEQDTEWKELIDLVNISLVSRTGLVLRLGLEGSEFALQPRFVGLPFHQHNANTNELLSGQKFWLFYPPNIGCQKGEHIDACYEVVKALGWQHVLDLPTRFGSNGSAVARGILNCRQHGNCSHVSHPSNSLIVRWILDIMPTLPASLQPPFRCLQQPGELLVLPSMWWHATLPLTETLVLKRDKSLEKYFNGMITLWFENHLQSSVEVFYYDDQDKREYEKGVLDPGKNRSYKAYPNNLWLCRISQHPARTVVARCRTSKRGSAGFHAEERCVIKATELDLSSEL